MRDEEKAQNEEQAADTKMDSPAAVAPLWRTHIVCVAALIVSGVLFGLPTLPEPFGVDQGIYAYIAERLLEGAVDHRDVFDHKPPGIHFAYAKAFFVFGDTMWSIRLLDLLAAVAAAIALYAVGCIWINARAGVIAGILYVGFYAGFFDWMSRAQPESWVNLCFIAALAECSRRRTGQATDVRPGAQERLAPFLGGIFLGVGIWFKPTILMLAPLGLFLLVCNAAACESNKGRRFAGDLAALGAGIAVPAAVVLGYYAWNSGLRDLYEAVVVFNTRYHSRLDLVREWRDLWRAFDYILRPLYGLSVLAAMSGAAATIPRLRGPLALGFAWLALAFATVFWQGSFARVHYVPVLPPLVFLGALAVESGIEWGRHVFASAAPPEYPLRRDKSLPGRNLFFLPAVGVVLLAVNLGGLTAGRWSKLHALVSGKVSLEQYYASYWLKGAPKKGGYSFQDLREIAAYLEANTTPDQTIFVWGFRPILAWLAHRRMPARFCFRYPLTRANNPRWWNEFLGDLDRSPPEFFVVVLDDRGRYHPETSKDALENNGALSRFLHGRYELDRTITDFEIWRIKGKR